MADPDTTYRSKDEVIKARKERDPLNYIRILLLENNLATETEIEVLI